MLRCDFCMPQRSHPTKSPKKPLMPGTRLGGFRVVDAKGRIRTLPADIPRSQRFLHGIARKAAAQQKAAQVHKKVLVPKILSRHTVVRMLHRMGFRQDGTTHFFHPDFGGLIVPIGAEANNITVRKNAALRRVVEAYLKKGEKL